MVWVAFSLAKAIMPVMIVGISVRCSALNLVRQQPDVIACMPAMQPGFVVAIGEFRHFYDLNTIRRSEAHILLQPIFGISAKHVRR